LVDSCECVNMHGPTNPKFKLYMCVSSYFALPRLLLWMQCCSAGEVPSTDVQTKRSWNKLRALVLCIDGPGWLSRYSDSLRAGWSLDRIPVWTRFSAPYQTGPGALPPSYTMGTGSFSGVKRAGRDVDHPPHLAPRLKKEYSYISSYGPSWLFLGWTLPFTFNIVYRAFHYLITFGEKKNGALRYTGPAGLSYIGPPT
jgi:hypothetical protein